MDDHPRRPARRPALPDRLTPADPPGTRVCSSREPAVQGEPVDAVGPRPTADAVLGLEDDDLPPWWP